MKLKNTIMLARITQSSKSPLNHGNHRTISLISDPRQLNLKFCDIAYVGRENSRARWVGLPKGWSETSLRVAILENISCAVAHQEFQRLENTTVLRLLYIRISSLEQKRKFKKELKEFST